MKMMENKQSGEYESNPKGIKLMMMRDENLVIFSQIRG